MSGSYVKCISFVRNCQASFQSDYHFTYPETMYEESVYITFHHLQELPFFKLKNILYFIITFKLCTKYSLFH